MLADMKTHDRRGAACWCGGPRGWAGPGPAFAAAEGSQSKLFAGEVAVRTTEQAVQILGGAGYIRDNPVERW